MTKALDGTDVLVLPLTGTGKTAISVMFELVLNHLKNQSTSLQIVKGEAGVRLLKKLAGCQILSPSWDRKLREEVVNDLIDQIGEIHL